MGVAPGEEGMMEGVTCGIMAWYTLILSSAGFQNLPYERVKIVSFVQS